MPLPSGFVPGPVVKVAKSALAATVASRIVDVRVEASTGVASQCTLRLDDADFTVLDSGPFAVSAELEVGFAASSTTVVPVFTGEVVGLAIEQGAHDRHELVVTALDKTHRLSGFTRIRTWQNKTYTDLVKEIAGAAGLTGSVTIKPDPQHLYLVQTGTDADLLDEIAERTGCEWRVEDTKLVFGPRAKPSSPVTLTFGENLIRFRASISAADQLTKVTVRGWDPAKKQVIKSEKPLDDPTMHGSDAPLAAQDAPSSAQSFGQPAVTVGAVGVNSAAEADAVAAAYVSRAGAATFVARGEVFIDPNLKPGGAVTVGGVGTKLAGTYRLSSVEHVFGAGQAAITRFTVHGNDPGTLVDLLGARPRGPDPWGRVGFVIGIVTNNNDPDGLGRVKVKYPTLSDADESAWARIVTMGAGPTRGLLVMPELEDEVLLGFEHGDLRRPLVLGSLWNGKAKPPSTKFIDGKKVVELLLMTRDGTALALRDEAGGKKRHVEIVLPNGGTKLHLAEDKVELWSQDKPLQLKAGNATVTLDGKGNIEVKGTKITVKAENEIDMQAANVKVKASAQLTLEGKVVEVKSSGPAKVQATGPLELKGLPVKVN